MVIKAQLLKSFTVRQLIVEMRDLYLRDNKPWILMSSQGKDSTTVTSLVWEMLSELPEEQRFKPVHLVTGDTLVEVPAMRTYVNRSLEAMRTAARAQRLPIEIHTAKPAMKNRFFRQCLGKGNPPPNERSRFRWCTDKLKIQPSEYLVDQVIQQHLDLFAGYDCLMLLGVRLQESTKRAGTMNRYSLDEKFARHAKYPNVLIYRPVMDFSSDDIWNYLLHKNILGWGIDANELYELYRDSAGECPLTLPDGRQSKTCGGSRFGCWTCCYAGMEDKMLINQIDNGDDSLVPLLFWKQSLYQMRNDIRYRLPLRRQKKAKVKSYESPLLELDGVEVVQSDAEYDAGSLTLYARRLLLESLLKAQQESGYVLIEPEEVQAILKDWREEGYGVSFAELQPQHFPYDGLLTYGKDGNLNERESRTQTPVFELRRTLEESDVHSLYCRLNRSYEGISLIADRSYRGYKFIVNHRDILSDEQAERYLNDWLSLVLPGDAVLDSVYDEEAFGWFDPEEA